MFISRHLTVLLIYGYELGFGLIYNYQRAVETTYMDVITLMGFSADLLLT